MMRTIAAVATMALLGFGVASRAQDTRVTGTLSADFSDRLGTGSYRIDYDCTGEPTCRGTYRAAVRYTGCSNTWFVSDAFSATGMDLSQAGNLRGTVTLTKLDFGDTMNADGTCTMKPNHTDIVLAYTGTWDGVRDGTIALAPILNDEEGGGPVVISGPFRAERAPPVFPMTVRASFENNVANVSADIQFRPEDVGRSASVFVFALAPATIVKSLERAKDWGHEAKGGAKDTPVQCVLAQLSANGQLTGVTTATMQPYLTGVLSAAGQSVTIASNVSTSNIAGATLYVGYGATADAMLQSGANRSAVTAPGSVQCKPAPPRTGWWWNPLEPGRGFSVEVRGHNVFFAAFHYEATGRSTWHVANGPTSLDGSLYVGDLLSASGGQTLGGAYGGFPTLSYTGGLTLAFADNARGTMIWPGGAVPIERFAIVPGGLTAPAQANQPETGWWWNPEESGRGFFIEWQNGSVDIAGYMYDEQGNPVWYLGVYPTPDARSIAGNWWSYANGQAMNGAHRNATRVSENVAPVTVRFTSATTAVMTLPNGRTTRLERHRF